MTSQRTFAWEAIPEVHISKVNNIQALRPSKDGVFARPATQIQSTLSLKNLYRDGGGGGEGRADTFLKRGTLGAAPNYCLFTTGKRQFHVIKVALYKKSEKQLTYKAFSYCFIAGFICCFIIALSSSLSIN